MYDGVPWVGLVHGTEMGVEGQMESVCVARWFLCMG